MAAKNAGCESSHSRSFSPNINCWQWLMNATQSGKLISLIYLYFFRIYACRKPIRPWSCGESCVESNSGGRLRGREQLRPDCLPKTSQNTGCNVRSSHAECEPLSSSSPASVAECLDLSPGFSLQHLFRPKETERDREGSRSLAIITKIAQSHSLPPAEALRRHSPSLHIV